MACTVVEAFELIELFDAHSADANANAARLRARPFVSFHLPICSEPPDVVARTLIALSNLNYDLFEVVVVDNNTANELLWRPVEALCATLGPRFRFFHLPKWPGFKAGALNFALEHTAPEASLIGVVDADYETTRFYLDDVLGFFDDEEVAFVQTPQDYREWSHSAFSRMCYWEYWQVFAVSMKLRNRRNAILMHGTMSLVRKDAVIRAGGWAEWCLTEDSEMGLRLLAAGCKSVYVTKTYGRGLVPFTFRDYKRQRRRWVIGGVQQLKRHASLFVPWKSSRGQLTRVQILHFLRGWLLWFRDGVVVTSVPMAIAASAAALGNVLDANALLPLAIGIGCVLCQLALRHMLVYRLYLAVPWRDALGAMIANLSLTWTVGCAWLVGSTRSSQVFQRTPKRPHVDPGWAAIARDELIVGTLLLLMGFAIAFRFGISGWATVVALWAYSALFFPAAWMARRAERDTISALDAYESRGDPPS